MDEFSFGWLYDSGIPPSHSLEGRLEEWQDVLQALQGHNGPLLCLSSEHRYQRCLFGRQCFLVDRPVRQQVIFGPEWDCIRALPGVPLVLLLTLYEDCKPLQTNLLFAHGRRHESDEAHQEDRPVH